MLTARDGDEDGGGVRLEPGDGAAGNGTTTTIPAPLAVTGRIPCGPEVQHGTEEPVVVPLADGEMTIDRSRGFVWRQSTGSMSDPRLEGTVYQSEDPDSYTLPGGEAGPSFGISTKRIENDEGAWQGSAEVLNFPDGTWVASPYVMVGEGAYEGLTAIYLVNIFNCGENIQGYIIEGDIPAARPVQRRVAGDVRDPRQPGSVSPLERMRAVGVRMGSVGSSPATRCSPRLAAGGPLHRRGSRR